MSPVDFDTPGQTWRSIHTYSPLCSRRSLPWVHIQRRVEEKDRCDSSVKNSSPKKTPTRRTCPENGKPIAPNDTSSLSTVRTSETPWKRTNTTWHRNIIDDDWAINQSICDIYTSATKSFFNRIVATLSITCAFIIYMNIIQMSIMTINKNPNYKSLII